MAGGVIEAPPRSVIWPIMNLPLYSPTAPAGAEARVAEVGAGVHCRGGVVELVEAGRVPAVARRGVFPLRLGRQPLAGPDA